MQGLKLPKIFGLGGLRFICSAGTKDDMIYRLSFFISNYDHYNHFIKLTFYCRNVEKGAQAAAEVIQT